MDRKKFFIFLILFEFIIISLFSYTSKVFASSITYNNQEINLSLYDSNPALLLYDSEENHYIYFKFFVTGYQPTLSDDVKYYCTKSDDDSLTFGAYLNSSPMDHVDLYYYDIASGSVSGLISSFATYSYTLSSSRYHCVYKNVNVYSDSTFSALSTSSFFLLAPLAQIVERQNLTPVLAQVVHLLPLILALLVSFIGLKKALTMLFHFLRKS